MEYENQTPDQLIATIEKLEDQLKLTEARRARDADKLATISSALISIIEDGINDIIDARLGAAIESAVESEMDYRDLLPRDEFDDMFNDALADVDVNLSR